jgi:hypothetical protein
VLHDCVKKFLTILLGCTCRQLEVSKHFVKPDVSLIVGLHNWRLDWQRVNNIMRRPSVWPGGGTMEQVVEMMFRTGVDPKWGLR